MLSLVIQSQLAGYTAGRELHPALKIKTQLYRSSMFFVNMDANWGRSWWGVSDDPNAKGRLLEKTPFQVT